MKTTSAILAGAVAALCAVADPAHASTFVIASPDGDESKFFFNASSLSNNSLTAAFFGSTPGYTTAENVDATTLGNVSGLDNGFGSIDGTNPHISHTLGELTLTPTTGTAFDGIFFSGQVQIVPGTMIASATIHISVTGEDNVTTNLTVSGLGIGQDFTDIGVEALNDTDLIESVRIYGDSGEFFEDIKHVQFSGVIGGSVPEPAAWIVMITGFGLLGAWLRSRTIDGIAGTDPAKPPVAKLAKDSLTPPT